MPTARQRASLDSDRAAADAAASARIASMLQRLEALKQPGRPPAATPVASRPAPQPSTPAPVKVAAATGADSLFYDKGTATADGFRPSYWSYEGRAEAELAAAAPVPPAPPAAAPIGKAAEPQAAPSEAPGDLARTIEAVLDDKSYGPGRHKQGAAASPRRPGAPAVTADTLMADLSVARQVKAGEPKPTKRRRAKPETAAKPRSLIDQLFAYGGIAIVLVVLYALSPWGRESLAPVARLLN